jgi:hypothetical protein
MNMKVVKLGTGRYNIFLSAVSPDAVIVATPVKAETNPVLLNAGTRVGQEDQIFVETQHLVFEDSRDPDSRMVVRPVDAPFKFVVITAPNRPPV